MPTKPSTSAGTATLDAAKAVAITEAIMNETPDLARGVAAQNISGFQVAGDGTVTIAGTTETIHAIGDYVLNFAPAANAFVNALVNRVAYVTISSRMYTNPWAGMKKGRLEFGETVEEIFVNLCKPYQFSPSAAEQEVYKRVIPDVRAAFHTMNFQKFYPITVSDDQLRQAFLSWQGIADLIAQIVNSVHTSANTDEYLVMKYMLARAILNGNLTPVVVSEPTKENAVDVATKFRQMARLLTYQSDKYNMAGVTTHTPIDDQYLIVTAEFEGVMDMNVLATAYNLPYADFIGRVIGVDSYVDMDWNRLRALFTDEAGQIDPSFEEWTSEERQILSTVPAVCVDVNFWQVWDNLEKMTENYNGRGLYWNYFYHVWKTFSISPFAQAVCYTGQAGSITSVAVTPVNAALPAGADLELSASVSRQGVVNKAVVWTMTGNDSTGSYVSDTGKVHVAKDETSPTLTVKATSVADASKAGTSTITVSNG